MLLCEEREIQITKRNAIVPRKAIAITITKISNRTTPICDVKMPI